MNKIIEFLLNHNELQSAQFCDPNVALERRLRRKIHPTEIGVFKCMDGRLNLSVMTNTPPGFLTPFRNMGAEFDLGWPELNALISEWIDYTLNMGRRCLVLTTYHWSKGHWEHGCGGFDNNVDQALSAALKLRKQFERVFGIKVVYPLLVGVETDSDALVIHGENEGVLDLSKCSASISDEELRLNIEQLCPNMHPQIVCDFIPLLRGNIEHIAELREQGREISDYTHQEKVIIVGRGADWLHQLNFALIVGPYDPNLSRPITKAASIALGNLSRRTDIDQGTVLMSSALIRDSIAYKPLLAVEKARTMLDVARAIITENVPQLIPHLHYLAGIVDANTRRFQRINL
ncbi:hypothetical protein A2477_00530 [Candidatus Falkowbacteria bacterium RIFOXYC2_FULL_47_12]|uniref:Carboxysome Shell Carbonic Anhydrase catalytic domain-containing protein n=2 Tax=Candidatus Falkowiibacteriota TaxID=1752728 RepID=A0A1F5TLX1_9BACT|nr:MAG: hypothetical protein A2242_00245 [Candidatus Falkowbacteria bacterium RIFOXYA2_FULL_47_9]OGF39856.1 MAG: hypothetical protein A2477_00530 [Candidatus Falkowbacteria bacterium RIFOXYC2_FULL_47_12]